MPGVCFDGLLGLLTHFVVNQTIEKNFFYRLWPAAFDVVLSRQQAQARRWWMGSLKFAIGLEPPFLRILPAAFTSSFLLPLLPSCCWIGVLKVFFCSFLKSFFSDRFGRSLDLEENLLDKKSLFRFFFSWNFRFLIGKSGFDLSWSTAFSRSGTFHLDHPEPFMKKFENL